MIKAMEEKRMSTPDTEDWLMKAEYATDPVQRSQYAQKALEIDPTNLTAALLAEEGQSGKDKIHILAKYAGMLREKIQQTEDPSTLDITPLVKYQHELENSGLTEEAGKVAYEIVNLEGKFDYRMQYAVMCAYAHCGYKESAMAFYEECGCPDDSEFLLPLTLLCYKAGNVDEAEQYLRRLTEVNPDAKEFVAEWAASGIGVYEDPSNEKQQNGARLYRHVTDFAYLYVDAAPFVTWAASKI